MASEIVFSMQSFKGHGTVVSCMSTSSGVVLRLQLFLMPCLHYCTPSVGPVWNHAHLHLHHKAYLCCHNQTMGSYVCRKIVHALAQVTISHGIQRRASQPTTLDVHIPSPLLCVYHNRTNANHLLLWWSKVAQYGYGTVCSCSRTLPYS